MAKKVKEIKAGWHYDGHSTSASRDKEIMRRACEKEAEKYLKRMKSDGFISSKAKVSNVEVIRNEGGWSKTKKSWDGKRNRSVGGTAVCSLYIENI